MEAKKREAQLVATILQLERKLCRASEQALAEVDHLLRLKTEFLCNMNHELRTPLSGILGMATIGLRAADPAKSRLACHHILEAGHKLSALVENVLDFSSLDAGQCTLQPTRTALCKTVEAIAQRILLQAAAKGLAFDHRQGSNLPPCCQIDRRRLGQILNHLLGNALKFTSQGCITLTSERHDTWLVFTVADTGIGLSTEHVRQLFRPFEQGDGSPSRHFGGMGLGLALTDHLVRQMGGTIQVESVLGQGTRFEVRLPYIEP